MLIETGAETVNEGHCADVQVRLVCIGRARAMGLQVLRNDPQENAQHHIQCCSVALHKVAQPLGHGEHPLAHRQAREDMVYEVRRRLHHAPGIARGAHTPAFAGKGHEVVVPAIITTSAGKAMGKDAALQIFGKRLAHKGLGCVVVALAVELTRAGQL